MNISEQAQVQTVICNINSMCDMIGRKRISFDTLFNTPLAELRRIQDELITEYNVAVKDRKNVR